MDRKLVYLFGAFAGLSDLSGHEYSRPKDPDYVAPDTELDKVLRDIFTVDPTTGAPRGDIAYFLSGNGNPMIKQWIENNLFTSMRSSGAYDPATHSDDLIVEMSRRSDESVMDYSSRLLGLYDAAKKEELKLRESLKPQEE